jgi:hypothetical protein
MILRNCKPVALSLALLFLTQTAAAELPPFVYKQWQQAAPEYLEIKVRSSKTSETDAGEYKSIDVVIEAEVLSVERSASGMMPGARIRISYQHRIYKQPLAGASQVPILGRDKIYPAFLKKVAVGVYEPAARGKSFEIVK